MRSLNSYILLWLLTFITGFNASASEFGLQKDPQKVIETIFATAQKGNPLQSIDSVKLLDNLFNYNQLALNILGATAKQIKVDDVEWFKKTIREILIKTIYPKANDFLKNVKITYRKSFVDGAKAKVSSQIQSKGETTDVVYLLEKDSENWRVVDVSIDDESWVKTINEKMLKSYKEKGWIGVKDLLNKRLKELK